MAAPQSGSDAVGSQLGKILASPEFVNSERLSRFLAYIVQEFRSGRGNQLKEYSIGVEVYARSETYDPRIDAIVRVEAGRLRAKLTRYYDQYGQQDPIVISLPKGSYVPAIVEREHAGAQAPATLRESLPGASVRLSARRRAPILVLILLTAGIAGYRFWGPRESRKSPSIAVLPLENLSTDPEQEYFSDGMTDALITDLAKIRTLHVKSRTSALSYKRAKKPLAEVARELGVDYVVEGTVQRAGQRVKITAQLIALPAERHVWAESYERDLRDIFALQRELASVIAHEVRAQLTAQDRTRLAVARQVSHEAYEAYLKGRYFQEKRTEDGLKRAIDYFHEAIRRDRSYGEAYSGLADSQTYLINHGYVPPLEAGPQAKVMAAKALEIDNTLAEAHTSLAYIRMIYDWDFPGAEAEFRRAIEIDPDYTRAHSLYACYFTAHERFDEALGEMRRALDLDPLSAYDNANLGFHLLMSRRDDEAIEQLQKTVEIAPASWQAHTWMSMVLVQKRRLREAVAHGEQGVSLLPESTATIANLAYAYAEAGETDRARALLERLLALRRRKYVSAHDIAVVFTSLGNRGEALAWLEKAYQERDGMLWIRPAVDRRFDSLRNEPRFRAILRDLRLPQ